MEYPADEYKKKYHLADGNFALSAIHFPKNMQELLSARRRLVFDEFLLFILAVQLLKEKTEASAECVSYASGLDDRAGDRESAL